MCILTEPGEATQPPTNCGDPYAAATMPDAVDGILVIFVVN
jgi:hypothetical protein